MAGDWSDWHWDPSLFAGAAEFYDRGRLPYSAGLADSFASSLGLDGSGVLLDVGCGPGTVALRLAHLVADVVGVDPDKGMIAEARRLAIARGISNITWIQARAEELDEDLAPVRVATFAASFHWMDRPVVAAFVRRVLEPGGVVVHVDNRHQDGVPNTGGLAAIPHNEIDALQGRFLGADRRAGRSIRNTSPDDEASVFRAAGFVGPEVVLVHDGRVLRRSIDDVVAGVFSMSSTAPHLFADRLGEFESDLRGVLARHAADGVFGVRLPDNELKIWHPTG